MKHLFVLLTVCCTYSAMGQTCEEKLESARASHASGNYRLAIKQYQAAKGDCGETYGQSIEAAIIGIFDEIDGVKKAAVRDRARAIIALNYANVQKSIAEENAREARQQRAIANAALDSIQILLDTVQQLIAKGRELQNTFADSSTAKYLYKTGLKHFAYDTVAQSRDYQNALTYFALSRFLQPKDTLNYLIAAAQKGILAETAFLGGDLGQAKLYYDSIILLLDTIKYEAFFEKLRLEQIKEVEKLYSTFSVKNRPASEVLELVGNWWTLPKAFIRYKNAKAIVFKDNLANFERFPTLLNEFKGLDSLGFEHCINVRLLRSWEHTPHLQALSLKDNGNLYAIKNLDSLRQLRHLRIYNCPALTFVEGTASLKNFATEYSPQVRVSKLLHDNTQLEHLELADLPDDTLKVDYLTELKYLKLSRLKTKKLDGLDKNTQLRQLHINELGQLTTFVPPVQLQTIKISDCDRLSRINQWQPSAQLNTLLLFDNNELAQLPNWQQYPNLHTLVIQNDNEMKRMYGTKSLRNLKRIYVINNPNLVTNSIHAGFGFEWGVNLTSAKLEFEHRRRVPLINGRPDLGFKAVALYARKNFDYRTIAPQRYAEGFILGVAMNYYSPYWVYTGGGIGVGHVVNWFSDDTQSASTNFIWINNLGAQFAPRFLKKDKISINMDLYTVFLKKDYYILPSFGLTYYHTLGMHSKTRFVRPGDARRHIWVDGQKVKIGETATQF